MSDSKLINVLCMDDDVGLARLCQKKLERTGMYKVDLAINGNVGLSMYEKCIYDVIIIDSSMPELNGIEVVRILASKNILSPMIMVTGAGNETIAVEALKLGVDDYLIKDLEVGYLELLPSVIQGTLAKKQLLKEKSKMEEAMRRQNRALECAGQTIFMTDINGKIIYVNPAFTNLAGYTPEEAIGKTPAILKTERHPDDFYKNMWETILKGDIWIGEVTNKRKDGTLFEAHLTISPVFDNEKKIESFVAIQTDITEHIRLEEELKKLSSVVEQTSDHIIITDKNGNIEYTNPAFEKATGYKKEEVTGKKPQILKSGRHDDDFYKNLWETVLSAKVFRAEFINKKKNGELFHEEKTITPIKIRFKNHEHQHYVSTGRDITDRIKLEKTREKLIIDLQKALKEIKTLSGMLPICASCKKIRDDKGYWNQIESYIQERSEAEFTHSICPECRDTLYPELKRK